MLTTQQLREWREKIRFNKEQAILSAAHYPDSEVLTKYYTSQACIADAQENLIERLIRQSREQEIENASKN